MTSYIKCGDSHNFGRRVFVFQDTSGKIRVEKPRTVFWEYLFLDFSSPLRKILREVSCQIDFDSLLGNINVEMKDDGKSGFTEFYREPPGDLFDPKSNWYENYGRMLAFCSIFGITDLHFDNALYSDNGIQLVDIESVFWNTILPSETLLLPKNTENIPRSILSKVGLREFNSFDSDKILNIINGVIEVFSFFSDSNNTFLRRFLDILPQIQNHHIRVLIRNTRDYKEKHNFYHEEKLQLSRADIPYFFVTYGESKGLFYYADVDRIERVVSSSDELSKKVIRSANTVQFLLSIDRLRKLEKNLISEVLDKLWSKSCASINYQDLSIVRELDTISVVTKNSVFKLKDR